MVNIEKINIRKILDSRGNPTVEVEIYTASGYGCAAAPSGASTGSNEVEAFPEKGVDYAIENFEKTVAPELLSLDVTEQDHIDVLLQELDGTEHFQNIGGNVAVATSLAVAKAAAFSYGLPLYRYLGGSLANAMPFPLGNVLGGGAHAIGGTDIQEYLATALGPTVKKSIFANALVHGNVRKMLLKRFPKSVIGKGDEGGWIAKMDNEEALELVAEACGEVSDIVGFPIKPSLDFAASELYENGKYHYKNQVLDKEGQIDFVTKLIDDFDLYIVEDPLEEDDFDGYAELNKAVGKRCLIVGDDLFVTNCARLNLGISKAAANAILIKPNQVGTLTSTVEAIRVAHENGYRTIMSHRSGETADNTIAHIAVAFGCHAIKTGVVGGERTAKLNELIRIEDEFTKVGGYRGE